MFCIQCGNYNPDNAAFCGGCGSRLEKGTNPPPFMPTGGVPSSSGASSPAGEYIPIVQEVPQTQDVPPNGYGTSQSYPPPTYPTNDRYRSAEVFGGPQPSFTGQSAPSIENYHNIPQMPTTPPYVYPQAPPTPPPVVRQPWYKSLSKPMPIWALIVSVLVVVLILVALQVTGSDWAAGAQQMGIVAGILALVVVLVTGVRILFGMAAKSNPTRLLQLVAAGLSILLLLLLCLVGLTQQSTIHSLQAHAWEGQQRWQSSINEYQLAGEGAPTSENIAQVYNEWGEQLNSQQRYVVSIAKFNTVLTGYGSASAGVARAQSDTITAYLAWGQQSSQQHDYKAATSHYDALLQLSYCSTTCHSQANALDATAYYNLAETQLAAKNYADAITNFQTVVSRFSSSPEAQKLHRDYAKALFGHGQEQLTSASCSSAIPTYQQLSTKFGDTPEGQQATSALKAPQPVKGHFVTSVPNNSALTPMAALVQGLYVNISTDQFFSLLGASPTTVIQPDGSFSFKSMKQGTYDLVWGTDNSDGNQLFYITHRGNALVYIATVGPLCPYDFGDINEPIPSAP